MEDLLENIEDNEMFLALYSRAKIPKQCQELFESLKELAEKDLEVNATNLYALTMKREQLVLFCKLINKIDRKEFYENIRCQT